MIDAADPELTIGVIGAGAMGQGIAQVALQGGMRVLVHDAREGGASAGLDQVFGRLERLVEKGQAQPGDVAQMRARATHVSDLAEFRGCHLVVEAVFEDLELKQSLFRQLEDIVEAECVIVSNTSSLLIASITRVCTSRERMAGMHFFNPVPLMRLVEVVRGPDTGADVIAFLTTIAKRMGRTPVVARDAPGFIVNLGGRAYTTEAMRLLHENVATPAQIDAIMRDCCGFRMGPCELMDLTGMDVNYPVTRLVYEGYGEDRRLATSFPHLALLESGRLGRKSGQGHFRYDAAGKMIDAPSPDHETSGPPSQRVVLAEENARLRDFCAAIGLGVSAKDDGVSPLLAAPMGEDCSSVCARLQLAPDRVVAIDLSADTARRVTIMTAPGADARQRDAVASAIAASGRKVSAIADSPGFVAQRMRAMIANLGCEMAQSEVASPEEIDTALRLGLNYPHGPLELVQIMGAPALLEILQTIQNITGDDRYRPSVWLRRRALLGLDIHTPA